MIKTFADKDAEALFNGIRVRRLVNIEGPARCKLEYLDAAGALDDLKVPPGKLHPLEGELKGHWSVWVNGDWRVTFRFVRTDVELVDYRRLQT